MSSVDTLFRFLDILAMVAFPSFGFLFAIIFMTDWQYMGSRAQIFDLAMGRKVTYKWGRYLVMAMVSAAWLLARHW